MNNKQKLALAVVVIAALAYLYGQGGLSPPIQHPAESETSVSDAALTEAYEQHARNLQVDGQGVVLKILPDDNSGSRHQKFIVKLNSGQTVLIAHNIDLAPRVSPLNKGDAVMFRGEYDWTENGGVVHWTHHDPARRHTPGWIKRSGRTFQ